MNGRLGIATLVLALLPFPVWTQGASDAMPLLVAKARALDSRGRQDLGARAWKQVLQNDPKNAEALAALSRYSHQMGDEAAANDYFNQLRKVKPDAAPPSEPATPAAPRDPRLRKAESLAQSGKYEEATQAYQEIYGREPPPGPVAAQYYETMAGAKGRTDEAIAGLERLLKTNPESSEYRLALGRIYTYRPPTRLQGLRMLASIPAASLYGPRARAALRQALVWENGSAGSLPMLRDYLAQNSDPELAKLLTVASAAAARPPAPSPREKAGYEALNAGKTDEAVALFEKVISEAPSSATAYAGLGYARMKRQDWVDAAQAWDQALKLAPGKKEYMTAQGEARYFLAMDEGTKALAEGNAVFARQRFEAALVLRPASVEAQRGLAGAMMAAGEGKAASGLFEKMVAADPSAENWRNMLISRAQPGDEKEVLALWQKAPDAVRKALQSDVEFQLLLGGIYLRVALPKDAAASYQAAAVADPKNVVAWEGWLAALVASKDEAKAYEVLSSMPVETYKSALERPGFLRSAAMIQTHLGRFDVVESLLLKWIAREGMDKTPADIQEQLANIWMKQGKTEQAEKLLRSLLAKDPNNAGATRMLLAALQSQNRAAEALVESRKIPVMVQAQLQQDPDYVALIASINSDAGNQAEALRLVRETLGRFSQKGEQPPGHLLLQEAWLLLNTGADGRELFSVLRMLGSRSDLTATEQASYMDVWSVWAQRQADQALRGGDASRAIAILAEAAKLLPSDARIRSAYAGTLVKAGETKKALAVYKAWGLVGATPTDYSAAIGMAMAEKSDLSKRWLDDAMKKFPADPQILGMAGEQAAQMGDFKRAEMYYRNALALAEAKPKPDTAPLFANREPGNALGRLIVGEEATAEKSAPATEHLGRVLSGETAPSAGGEFTNSAAPVKSESDRLGERLQSLEARNAPSIDVAPSVQARSGTPGFDRRTLFQTEISTSRVFENAVRLSLVVTPVSLRTDASDGSSKTFRLGLLPVGSSFAAQSVAGLGAEVRISTENFGLHGGAAPQGFLVNNYIGGLRFRPSGGHLTILLTRDTVKDSLLSYAGQQDPITKRVWGGVVANQGLLTGNWGSEKSGFYLSGGYGIITGRDVETNHMFNGNGGTYWRVLQHADWALILGLNLTGLAYEKNLRYYTLGHGGYFSPQRFYIFNVPVTWRGSYGPRMRYVLNAGLGMQHFREDSSPYFPTLPSLQNVTLQSYPGQSQTGASYSVDFRAIYQLAGEWFVEGFFNLNNARNYTEQSAGFALKYGFRPRPVGAAFSQPEVPDWKGAQPLQP